MILKKQTYNLMGKEQLNIWDLFNKIAVKKNKKTLKMTIRSDSGVRPEKGTSGQGRLGQYLQLKMQYSGTIG